MMLSGFITKESMVQNAEVLQASLGEVPQRCTCTGVRAAKGGGVANGGGRAPVVVPVEHPGCLRQAEDVAWRA